MLRSKASALSSAREVFAGRDVLAFVGNEAACAALVKAGSSSLDADLITAFTHVLAAELQCRVGVEWVVPASNPGDGLSRDGLRDARTLQQGWRLQASSHPSWQELEEALAHIP